jgi:LPXTG-motif cell wall-anchored protein
MPPLRIPFRVAGRSATRWIATVFFGLTPGLAAADHGAPVLPPRTGVDWMSWLLVVGAVAAVSLAAWAFFAPDRPAARPGPTAPDGSEPESAAPPAR